MTITEEGCKNRLLWIRRYMKSSERKYYLVVKGQSKSQCIPRVMKYHQKSLHPFIV